MELRHLRYFVAVARELHFGRAAEQLHICQPPLSQQIMQMEKELGFALFTRTKRSVALTAAGDLLYRDAIDILAKLEQAVERAKRASRGEVGQLRIGFVASSTFDILPSILKEFRGTWPEVDLVLTEMVAAQQGDALVREEIDLAFCRPTLIGRELETYRISAEPYLAAVPAQHPLARVGVIALGALSDEPFVLYPREPKPSYADDVCVVCERAGFSPRIVQETQQMQTALSLVSAGIGVTLVPKSMQGLHRSGIVYREIVDRHAVTELSLSYRRDRRSPLMVNFLTVVAGNIQRRDVARMPQWS